MPNKEQKEKVSKKNKKKKRLPAFRLS